MYNLTNKTIDRNTLKVTTVAIAMVLSGPALSWTTPTNLHENDDQLMWTSDAPSYNIYEDGAYVATVHGNNSYAPVFNNSVYQIVAHDHGRDFTTLSTPFLFLDDDGDDEEGESESDLEFQEAELYFELNNTDGDLGIHSLVDGGPWTELTYEDMNGRTLLDIRVEGPLAAQGMSEFFFESAEPTFDELAPAEFFSRFPEGIYDFEGVTLDGEDIEAEAELSHVLPAAPVLYIGNSATGSNEGCSDEDLDNPAAFLDSNGNLPVSWDPVTSSHPTIGRIGDIEVESYLFAFETEEVEISVELDSGETSFSVPAALVSSGELVKLEVLVEDSTHNQVATEACVIAM